MDIMGNRISPDMILPKYQYLHEIVRKAVKALMKCISHVLFPDPELVYITVLFASWLIRREN